MPRIFHLIAVFVLVGSAVYLYRVKYETIYLSEQVAKLKRDIAREKDAISMLHAEWQQLNSPERLQKLAHANSQLTTLRVHQSAGWAEIPDRSTTVDMIGDKLLSLGEDHPSSPSAHSGHARVKVPSTASEGPSNEN